MSAGPETSLILVVDDNEAGRYVSAHALRAAGFEVAEAATGEDALSVAATRRPDLVVLDVNLPDVHGFDVRDRLKSAPATANVPVVHLSATAVSAQSRVVGLQGGANAYLTAPLSDGELVATVGAVLRMAQAEKAARTAAAAWEMVWDSSATGLALLDVAGRFLRANPALGRLLGVDPADLIGSEIARLVHPDEVASTMAEFRTMVATRTSPRLERRGRRSDGTYVWVEVVASPIVDPDDSLPRYFVQVLDISARVRADAGLLARVKALTCLSAVGRDSLAGLGHSELAERTALHLCEAMPFPDDTSVSVDIDGAAFAHATVVGDAGTTSTAEIRVGGHTRGCIRVSDRRQPPVIGPDEHGLVAAVAEVVALSIERRDAQDALARKIDELQAVNEELGRSEDRFRKLLALAPAAIVGVDHTGRVRLVNALAEAAFGYGREELLGKFIEVLVPEPLRLAHARDRSVYLESPTVRPMGVGRDLEAIRKDGSRFPVTVSLSTVEAGDEVIVLAAVIDISERVREEQERARLEVTLARAQRLESVGQLAGGIAHDFNNLLAVIMNYAAFVHRVVEPEVREDVEQITLAAKRAADLVHQLLLFSRGQGASPEPLYLHNVLTGLQALLGRSIGEHMSLRVHSAHAVPPVLVDRSKIEQVLVNLVVNARDAMPEGGPIDVEIAAFEFGPDLTPPAGLTAGRYVRVEVRDAGSGMSQAVMEQAFDPFFTTKPRGKGTGLGLATVYGIVTEAGGVINLSSELESGTQVSVYLPAIPDFDEDHLPGDVELPPLGRGETVFVIEDESAVLEVTRRILERSRYIVVATHSPANALAMAAEMNTPPALILSDVVMPEVSGPELLNHLRARWPQIPALLMSGYAGDVNPPVAGVDLIAKPFTEGELLVRVRAALDAPA